MAKTLRVETDDQNVMTVWLDHADRSVNTFTPQVLDELADVVERIPASDGAPVGVIFASAKANVFVAGADLFEMRGMNPEQTLAFLEQGQKVFDQIAALPMPTVAAINGQCLGGGCELALACDYRVAADCGSITIGLKKTELQCLLGECIHEARVLKVGVTLSDTWKAVLPAAKAAIDALAARDGDGKELAEDEQALMENLAKLDQDRAKKVRVHVDGRRWATQQLASLDPAKLDKVCAAILPLQRSVEDTWWQRRRRRRPR